MRSPPHRAALVLILCAVLPSFVAQSDEPQPPRPLVERLAGHPFFSKLPLRAAPGFPPVDLVLQEPYGANAGWEAAPSNRFGPWAREIVRQFDERFAKPFALRRDPARAPASLVVLASEGDLVNYRKSTPGRRAHRFQEACYEAEIDAVVVAAASSARAVHLARYPGLHLVAWRELAAHAESPAGADLPLWVHWGLPSYLAWHTGFGPDTLRTRELDRSQFKDWFEAESRVRAKAGALFAIAELVAVRDAAAAAERLRGNAAAAGLQLDTNRASYLLWCGSILWTHYLDGGDGGRWRDGYGAYLAGGLRGDWSVEALRTALQLDPLGVGALERGFRDWLVQTGEGLRLIAARATEIETEPGPVEAAPALVPLEPQPDEIALGHGLALVLSRSGDLDGAIARLETLLAFDPEGAYAQRIARDLERARGFRGLRADFLTQLAASGDRLQLEHDGKRLNVRVAAVEADRITLRETRGGLDALPFAELESFQLARQMGRETGWLRAWPYALVDDERWQRQLDDDQPDARALRDDAAEWYPGAMRLGRVARELIAVGAGELPEDPAAAFALVERIAALVREHGALPEVELRRTALRARAAAALAHSWDRAQIAPDLAGAFEPLEGNRARLTYAFDDDGELPELAPGSAYPTQRVGGLPWLRLPPSQEVTGGELRAWGSAGWRLPVPFRAPLSVRMRFEVGYVPDGGASVCYWSLGACDDGQGNLVLLEDLGSLLVIDLPQNVALVDQMPGGKELGNPTYTLELRHDGTTASSFLNGAPVKELIASTRIAGDVVFNIHTDAPLSIEELVVEGELDEERARVRWIERKLAALGL